MTDQALATTVPLGPALTEQQAREIDRQGEEAVVFALLSLAQMGADASSKPAITPTTPSVMIPPFLKPKADGRRKRPGRGVGHPGSRRPTPGAIHVRVDHRLEACPDCHGTLTRTDQARTRITEDIPEAIEPVVTEHTIRRDWCPRCQKAVEPTVTDALPGAAIGNRTLVLSAWLHYGLGNTLSRIVAVFDHHLTMKVTPGGLIGMWYRLQVILFAWYLEIQAEALGSAVLHADETGWRVDGKAHWHHDRAERLPDRSEPGQPGVGPILQGGVRRDVGHRLLGGLQQGGLRATPGLPGSPAARVEDGGEIRPPRAEFAGVRQEAASPARRLDPTEEARGCAGRGIHLEA